MAVFVSVIIPTTGPAEGLEACLARLSHQSLLPNWELLLVDNAQTHICWKPLVDKFEGRLPLRVLRSDVPGLHAARHKGLFEARGDCLVYLDDDMLPGPEWLLSFSLAFDNPAVAVATGPIQPLADQKIPNSWSSLWRPLEGGGRYLPALSLLDAGSAERDLPAWFAFGGNLAIRKHLVMEGGGFRPDALPADLTWQRGDGETGLLQCLHKEGIRARYLPGAAVQHAFSPSRLTMKSLRRRARKEGYSTAYTLLRAPNGGTRLVMRTLWGLTATLLGGWLLPPVRRIYLTEHWIGTAQHGLRYLTDSKLRQWIARPDYLSDR